MNKNRYRGVIAGCDIHTSDVLVPELRIRAVGDEVKLAPSVALTAPGTTRLVVRERYAYLAGWARILAEPVEMVSFLMSQRMLRGIRERAERQTPAGA
ncbi:hypothetical protein ACQEVI_25905 [Promicromonospora sp. CA-289599]|uniref:hypothetical protein n=1 Tax=Promicromonospora sp. CA-289599 TaxID=3240014 RepID=UPI003D9210F0